MEQKQTRWAQRVEVVNVIYQDILTNHTNKKSNVLSQCFEVLNFNQDQMKIIEQYFIDWQETDKQVIALLKPTWPYSRMNALTKAIIHVAVSESHILDTPKSILIDQALIKWTSYCWIWTNEVQGALNLIFIFIS